MQNNRFAIPADIAVKVDEIMSASRARFGHDAFRMEVPPADPPPAVDPPKGDPPPDSPPADDPPGSDSLGDAGKQALDRMKAERNADREARKALEAEFAAFKAKTEGKEAEHAATQAAQKVKDDALAAANTRILKAEIRAAGAPKLADPADALLHINLSEFEVGSDGEVDATAIGAAIDDLIARKPYLAAQGGKKFQGSADGGARNDASKTSIDDQIAAATAAGNFGLAIALKQARQAAKANN